jgi:hypothetical protein
MRIVKINRDTIHFDCGSKIELKAQECDTCYHNRNNTCKFVLKRYSPPTHPTLDLNSIDMKVMSVDFDKNLKVSWVLGVGLFVGDETNTFLVPTEYDIRPCFLVFYDDKQMITPTESLKTMYLFNSNNKHIQCYINGMKHEITDATTLKIFCDFIGKYRNHLHKEILEYKNGRFSQMDSEIQKHKKILNDIIKHPKKIDYSNLSKLCAQIATLQSERDSMLFNYRNLKNKFKSINPLYIETQNLKL